MKKTWLIMLFILMITAASAETLTVSYRAPELVTTSLRGVGEWRSTDNFGMISSPGYPRLPYKQLNVLLPAGAIITNWEMQSPASQEPIHVQPEYNSLFSDGEHILGENHKFNPTTHLRYHGTGKWGNMTYARFDYLPYLYQTNTAQWSVAENVTITIQYQVSKQGKAAVTKNIRQEATSFFINPQQIDRSYYTANNRQYDMLFISTTALQSTLQPLLDFRQTQGLACHWANIDSILTSSIGANNPEKLRNYLIQQYQQSPFSYLLLVGDINTVPIAYLTPEPNGINSVPSDFYYSDLSSNFDSDNDGLLGEYSTGSGDQDDGMDFTPELFVGRITLNNASQLQTVVDRIIAFESSTSSYKEKVLAPGAILNYENEDNNTGWQMTNSDTWGEFAKASVWVDHPVVTLYEQEGLVPSTPSNYSLSESNFYSLLQTEDWGFVNWAAHGSPFSAARKIWIEDTNADSIAESNECDWRDLVNTTSFSTVSNHTGSVFFQASCQNGQLDTFDTCLGEVILRDKAVATIAATRTGWYKIGWKNPGWGGLSSYNYSVIENYFTHHNTYGESHALANLLHTNYFLFGDPLDTGGIIWPELQNVYTYLYFGDPAIGYQPVTNNTAGEVLIWEPNNTNQGLPLVRALQSTHHFNVVYTDKLIDDYDYLSQFEAIFVMAGFGDTYYNLFNESQEDMRLVNYLNQGGNLYIEGDLPWASNSILIGQLGTLTNQTPIDSILTLVGVDAMSGWQGSYQLPSGTYYPLLTMGSSTGIISNATETNWVTVCNSTERYKAIVSSVPLVGLYADTSALQTYVARLMSDVFLLEPVVANDQDTTIPPILSVQTSPNPFAGNVRINLLSDREGNATIKIYNVKGQQVCKQSIRTQKQQSQMWEWDGKDNNGKQVASGFYLLRVQQGDQIITKKMMCIR